MYKLPILLLATCLTCHLSAQDDSPYTEEGAMKMANSADESRLVETCSMLTQEGYFYYAEMFADKLIELKPENSNYNYRKAFLSLEVSRDYKNAIPMLEIAVQNTDVNYDMYSTKEESAPIDAFYHLARCYHFDEQLDKAEENYNLFIEHSKKKSERIPEAELRIIQVKNARKLMKEPVDCQIKNIGSTVNTKLPEYSPVISFDGSALFFTSRRPWKNGETNDMRDQKINQYPEDVYMSLLKEDSSGWNEPFKLDFCMPRRNEATLAVSTSERRIYLYEDSTGNGDIYYTDFYNSKFNDIQKLESKGINTKYWETHNMVSHDGTIMVFASNRKGGFGGRDLYIVKKEEDGSWSDPENMGSNINTKYDEDAPFISISNNQLYFGSNNEKSIGGFDIMMSELQEDGTWGESENLGYPFNSTNDDLFYTTTVDGLKGYLTSYREDGYGEKDIYEIRNEHLGAEPLAYLKGLIRTEDGSPLPEDFAINFELTCDNCEDYNKHRVIFPRLRDGVFMTGLLPCKSYTLYYINAEDNVPMGQEAFNTECDKKYQEVYTELILDVPNKTVVKKKEVITDFPNIDLVHYFGYNKNKVKSEKEKLIEFIDAVDKQLEDGRESITINIYSSASYVPTRTFKTNDKLATVRANNIESKLKNHYSNNEDFADRVNIVIVSTKVQGPEYNNDFKNHEKYRPYQYIKLKTE